MTMEKDRSSMFEEDDKIRKQKERKKQLMEENRQKPDDPRKQHGTDRGQGDRRGDKGQRDRDNTGIIHRLCL